MFHLNWISLIFILLFNFLLLLILFPWCHTFGENDFRQINPDSMISKRKRSKQDSHRVDPLHSRFLLALALD